MQDITGRIWQKQPRLKGVYKIWIRGGGRNFYERQRAAVHYHSMCTEKWFWLAPLYELPAELNPNNMFQPPYSKDDSGVATKFIDYDLFFENSLTLHATILKPFLVRLKDHLEAIQVCLGKIDEWLMVSQNKIDFLEKTFGTKLVLPNSAYFVSGKAPQLKTSHIDGTYKTTFKISEKVRKSSWKSFWTLSRQWSRIYVLASCYGLHPIKW
jgi:hypothetical protein